MISRGMKSASGLILDNGIFHEGSARLVNGRLVLSQKSSDDADIKGLILPKAINCHTHLGDSFIQKPENCTVQELVAPPNGLKHRMFKMVSEEQQVCSMREKISLMARTGTSHFIDFRECGLEGTRRLLMASLGSGVTPVILGRPELSTVDELSALLSVADGIGMSAISDVDFDSLMHISEHAQSMNKVFGIHASEVVREDMAMILALKPNLLVHMIKANIEDIEKCSSEGVPVAICPSSNHYFGFFPPLREMLDSGITVCLGTDNAMLAEPNVFNEIRQMRDMFPETIIPDDEILKIAFVNGRKVLNSLPGLGDANGLQSDFFALEAPIDEPFRAILNAKIEKIHMFEPGGIT